MKGPNVMKLADRQIRTKRKSQGPEIQSTKNPQIYNYPNIFSTGEKYLKKMNH
jgi:hypothetical protein